jgi:hypothetical protein
MNGNEKFDKKFFIIDFSQNRRIEKFVDICHIAKEL